jgi:hypothetical protein
MISILPPRFCLRLIESKRHFRWARNTGPPFSFVNPVAEIDVAARQDNPLMRPLLVRVSEIRKEEIRSAVRILQTLKPAAFLYVH